MGKNYPARPPEFLTLKTAVWWDISDCPVPDGYDAHQVRPSIEGALMSLGYSGPVSITAYGDLKQTPENVLRGLSSTGIAVEHTVKELRCSLMYADLLEWREHNPPPATMMLISNQVEDVFAYGLCRLQQREHGYNLVRADTRPYRVLSLLRSTKEWNWERLLTDPETPQRHVLRKCSETSESSQMLHCRSCRFVGQSVENFTKHLSGEEHAQQDTRVIQSTPPTVGPKYERAKVMSMRENCAAAPEFATSRITVWWDMSDCAVPGCYDARWVRPSIEGTLKKLGYSGHVSITAYGDMKHTPEHVLQGLSATGVALQHTILGKRYSLMHQDLRKVTPPATIMLISEYVICIKSLCWLQQRERGYNFVLACANASSEASALVTSAEWLWENILTDSETTRHVRRKCSGMGESTMHQCRSCDVVGRQSIGDFTKHLWSEEHAEEEIRFIQSTRPWPDEYVQPKVENSPKSKRLGIALRTGFRLGNYLRLTTNRRRSRRHTR